MKTKNLLLVVIVLGLFLTTSTALAQTEDPPIETIMSTSGSTSDREFSEVKTLNIGLESEITENNASIAHYGNIYAVAYIRGNDVVVATIFRSGNSTTFYRNTIWTDDNNSYFPSIAYEAESGLFIVTWIYDVYGNGVDFDIITVAVDPYTGRFGNGVVLANESERELSPDIACNPNDGSCLIVYYYENPEGEELVRGRFVNVTETGISTISPVFDVTSPGNKDIPHIAWSDAGSSYLVAYSMTNTSNVNTPLYVVLHDTWQNGGIQIIQGENYGIETSWYPSDHSKYVNDVTYDFCSEKFIMVYNYDVNGDGTNYDIHASAINSDGSGVFGPYPIATTDGKEMEAQISYNADPLPGIANAASCKLLIAYRRFEYSEGANGILAAEMVGNCSGTSPEYTITPVDDHFIVQESDPPDTITTNPAIAGGNYNEFLVTYTYETKGTVTEMDVLGKLFISEMPNYLPLFLQ